MSYKIDSLLEKGRIWDRIVIDELSKRIAGNIQAREIIFLCAVGRLVKNCKPASFNLLIHSGSSSGKDYIVEQVLELFPDGDYEHVSRMSPTTLNYYHTKEKEPAWTWNGKILHLEDISEGVLNHEVMKVMTSGDSRAVVTIKNEARVLEVEGKPVIITTTATSIPTKEILNRFSVVRLEESEEYIKRVIEHRTRIGRDGSEELYSEDVKEFLAGLKPYSVRIPYADKISGHFPSRELRENRNIDRLLDMIKAVAIINQKNKVKHRDGFIEADEKDYDIAKMVFENLYSGLPEIPLNRIQKEIVRVLEESEETLTSKEILAKLKNFITIQGFRPHMEKLENIEVLDGFEQRDVFNNPTRKYGLSQEFKNIKPIKLPDSVGL